MTATEGKVRLTKASAPSFVLAWRMGWFKTHLYSWRAYSRRPDDASRHRAACCRRALDDGASVIAAICARLMVVSAFLAAGRAALSPEREGGADG